MLHAVIMAGGGGTRFWPRSRKARPKQFLTLTGDRSLLQLALDRIEGLAPPERTWVITGEAYRAETAEAAADPAGRPHRRRAVRPRHRPLHRPRRRLDRARRPRRRHADDAGRSRHRAGAGVPPRRPGRRADRRGTPVGAGHVRHPADVRFHRLRLHPPRPRGRPPQRRHRLPRAQGRFQGEAGRRPGGTILRLRRILLEQRHLRLEGGGGAGPAARPAAAALLGRAAHRRRLGGAEPRRRFAIRIRGDGEDQHRLRGDGARPGGAGRPGALPLGRRGQLAGAGADEPAGRRRQHGAGRVLRPQHAWLRHGRRPRPADRRRSA